MIVATVLSTKPGTLPGSGHDPTYGPAQVLALREQFRKHLQMPHDFLCFSDVPCPDVSWVWLERDWGGWWSKLELFMAPWDRPVLYCDLDNVLLGDISSVIHNANGAGFWAAHDWDYPVLNSSLMLWKGDHRYIYESFAADPEGCAARLQTMPYYGDQGHIAQQLSLHGVTPRFWQHSFPRVFGSRWQASADKLGDARMVLWHGKPKPWQLGDYPEGSDLRRLKDASSGQ